MIEKLTIGNLYTKKDLTTLIREPNLRNVREGVYKCKNSNHYLLFVTLDKSKKAPDKKYNDFFYDTNFHWDSQTKQNINALPHHLIARHAHVAALLQIALNRTPPSHIYASVQSLMMSENRHFQKVLDIAFQRVP